MPKNDADKTARLEAHERAKSQAEATGRRFQQLREQLDAAHKDLIAATSEAEAAASAAFAEEEAERLKKCRDHEHAHRRQAADHCKSIRDRRHARESRGDQLDHTAISVVTIDNETHLVVAAHELMLEVSVFETSKGKGTRYKMGCGLSVDTPHSELDHERFDQTKIADCKTCHSAVIAMGTGLAPDLRAEYLTSAEYLAHERAKIARSNRENSGTE